MPTNDAEKIAPPESVTPIAPALSIKELVGVLIQHYGVKEGRYDLLVEFQIGVGGVGASPDERVPGAMIGIRAVGLTQAKGDSPTTVDAGEFTRSHSSRARQQPGEKTSSGKRPARRLGK